MTMAAESSCDVCVVGYGPVGATLANLLGLRSIPTLVLEREAAPYDLPRAVHFDDEVMRVFQTIGLAGEVEPTLRVSPGMHFVDAEGRMLVDWSRPMEIGPQGWHHSYRFHQPQLEAILREGVTRFPDVQVRSRCVFAGAVADAQGVTVQYRDLATDTPHEIRCRYLIGCDGARSPVRELIGAGMQDLRFNERWLVVDVMLKHPIAALGDHSVQYCDPARPATYVRGTGDRRRWEIALHADEDAAEMVTPACVWPLLRRWLTQDDAVLERAACYTFRSLIARQWRAGRMLIAGDAAHQTPPFLGQGLCAGIRDVANLAWKLERVLDGHAPDCLLDTYQSERAPHVHEYIDMAVRLGGLINATAPERVLREGAAPDGPLRMHSITPSLGPGLESGWSGPARRVAPQPDLSTGARLDDAVGYAFAMLLRPGFTATLPPALQARLRQPGLTVIEDPAPALCDWLHGIGAGAALVRPDRYVLGAARDPAEMESLLAAVSSRHLLSSGTLP